MPRAEMHWDYICLTLLTIATAVLAGVFFVLSIENFRKLRHQQNPDERRT